MTTTYGSVRYREHVPETDARVVTDLLDAGEA
jgi:Asp-tRNA(Asn)/Glu-tRNA(Gln) amidotransferase A subunit family amidase